MRIPTYMKWFVIAIGLLAAGAAWAQCVENIPFELPIGQSYCITVCAETGDFIFQLDGVRSGPEAVPVLTMREGCNHLNTLCDKTCTPIPVPDLLELGADPWAPDNYYGRSDCLEIHMWWMHDGVWGFEVYTTCDGCFCLSFDSQLPVQIKSDISAVAGDGEVTLAWSTASEFNNSHFVISRDHEDLASIPTLGNGSAGHDYRFVDAHQVENGRTYQYTLSSVDLSGQRNTYGTVSATPTTGAEVVKEYALLQNFPNPFNPTTQIRFNLPQSDFVSLSVYNPLGQKVATLVNSTVIAGEHSVNFDGHALTSGLYFYTIRIGDRFSATRKMLLVK